MTYESGADLSGVDFEDLVAEMIRRCGDTPDREGMMKTPERVAKAMAFLTKGYGEVPEAVVGDAIFSENHQSMVLVKDIELYSLCEHHMLPFFGKAHVAYIPNGNVMGLSKVARLVEAGLHGGGGEAHVGAQLVLLCTASQVRQNLRLPRPLVGPVGVGLERVAVQG